MSYDEIAKRAGYRHRGSAFKAVMKALDEAQVTEVENLRALEVSRLDALHRAHWERALAGDVRATLVVLRVMRMRLRVLGLVGGASAQGLDEPHFTSMILGS